MSAILNFESFVYTVILVICTATYIKQLRPSMFQRDSPAFYKRFLYKCWIIGDRLSPVVSATCVFMGLRYLFF